MLTIQAPGSGCPNCKKVDAHLKKITELAPRIDGACG